MLNPNDSKHLQFKRKIRILGFILLGVGLLCDVIGIVSIFSVFNQFNNFGNMSPIDDFGQIRITQFRGPSPLIGLLWVGAPLTIVGIVLTVFSYIGEVARYSATAVTPVATDTLNYVVDETKDSLKTVVGTISDGIKGTSDSKMTVKCRHCQAINEEQAKFCNNCGKPIVNHKVCTQCAAKNELEAVYCNKCGTRFYN